MDKTTKNQLAIMKILFKSVYMTCLKVEIKRLDKKHYQEIERQFKQAMKKATDLNNLEKRYFDRLKSSKELKNIPDQVYNFLLVGFASMKVKAVTLAEQVEKSSESLQQVVDEQEVHKVVEAVVLGGTEGTDVITEPQ